MGRKDDMMDDALAAYEESTGKIPDTRDYVALEDAVTNWDKEQAEDG